MIVLCHLIREVVYEWLQRHREMIAEELPGDGKPVVLGKDHLLRDRCIMIYSGRHRKTVRNQRKQIKRATMVMRMQMHYDRHIRQPILIS